MERDLPMYTCNLVKTSRKTHVISSSSGRSERQGIASLFLVHPHGDWYKKNSLSLVAVVSVDNNLLEIQWYTGDGYRPLVDFANWRVAMLNYSPDLLPENLTRMQRHNETDEVFVLLAGRCILFVGEGRDTVSRIHAEDLRPGRVYNVKQAVWHTHTLSSDAMVLVVENRDTTYDNSPFTPLNPAQHRELIDLTRSLWSEPDR